jgi:predicted transcriptional regulator of viral defense system
MSPKADSPIASTQKVRTLFKRHGGVLRTQQAIDAGIHPRTLYALRDAGVLECLSRGVYRLADAPPLANPDLVTVSLRAPEGVICLVSALAFHGLTTQIAHEVYLALPRGSERPRIDFPPVRTFWFTSNAFEAGIEKQILDGYPVRIYCAEKTLADTFKYRNKIGMETALEAIRLYKSKRRMNVEMLLKFADICRARKVMQPYLEAIL